MQQLNADVIIVGGGCCGVLAACQLLIKAIKPIKIVLLEKKNIVGEGVAYATSYTQHILNVPNQAMSAFPKHKDHFIKWLANNNYASEPLGFSPRYVFAEYLRDCLKDAIQLGSKVGATLNIVHCEAVKVTPIANYGWSVLDQTGQLYKSKAIILALGIFMRPHKESLVTATASIAIVGSGLSMADAILKLHHNKHRGEITVFARNGNLPLAHDLKSYTVINELHHALEWDATMSVSQAYSKFKNYLKQYCIDSDYPWQALIDSLRPYTQKFWQAWDVKNKQTFLRHLRGRWDIHRHRVAPQVSVELHKLLHDGFFKLKHASVININNTDSGYLNYYDFDANSVKSRVFECIIDCAGLITDYTKADSKLLQNLFRDNIITPGPLNKGINATVDGKLANGLYALGFALHGMLWESIAVPELRMQAEAIADALNIEMNAAVSLS